MPSAYLDHLVIAADSLAQGDEYIREKLGVEPQGGGQHVSHGTHNRIKATYRFIKNQDYTFENGFAANLTCLGCFEMRR